MLPRSAYKLQMQIHTGAFTKQHTLIIKVKDNMRGAKKQKEYVFEQMAAGFTTNTVTVSIFYFPFRADF